MFCHNCQSRAQRHERVRCIHLAYLTAQQIFATDSLRGKHLALVYLWSVLLLYLLVPAFRDCFRSTKGQSCFQFAFPRRGTYNLLWYLYIQVSNILLIEGKEF